MIHPASNQPRSSSPGSSNKQTHQRPNQSNPHRNPGSLRHPRQQIPAVRVGSKPEILPGSLKRIPGKLRSAVRPDPPPQPGAANHHQQKPNRDPGRPIGSKPPESSLIRSQLDLYSLAHNQWSSYQTSLQSSSMKLTKWVDPPFWFEFHWYSGKLTGL